MARKRYANAAAIVIFMIAIVLLVSSISAHANTISPIDGARVDVGLVLQYLVAILIAIIAWFVKKVDSRVDAIERQIAPYMYLETRLTGHDNEDKQLQTQINILRDTLNTNHPTKADTAEHRRIVEAGIREIKDEIRESGRQMNQRIDALNSHAWRGDIGLSP